MYAKWLCYTRTFHDLFYDEKKVNFYGISNTLRLELGTSDCIIQYLFRAYLMAKISHGKVAMKLKVCGKGLFVKLDSNIEEETGGVP